MPLNDGERQVAPTIDGIRKDHVARYQWIAKMLPPESRVLDIACGVGYGAFILAEHGHTVVAVDRDGEAIAYAMDHYAHALVSFRCDDVSCLVGLYPDDAFNVAISFETIEHLEDPKPFLKQLRRVAGSLVASVPNEAVFPYRNYKFHHRHYRPNEFKALIEGAGFEIKQWHGQAGKESEVEPDCMGRTIIVCADRAEQAKVVPFKGMHPTDEPLIDVSTMGGPAPRPVPKHVSIIGLGPSEAAYTDTIKRLGGRHAYCDETWVINSLGDGLAADLIFHMDDVRIQEVRAAAKPDGNIAKMLEWMRKHPGPIMTSRAHPDYPGLVEFPLEDVLNKLGYDYFNSTAAYAVAYAIYIGVEKISLWGIDYTLPNAHDAEKGRACVEYWIGRAMALGIQVAIPRRSSLLDALVPQNERLYGYGVLGSRDVDIVEQPDGSVKVLYAERTELPTAAEIEDAYDHSKHPAHSVATVA